MVKVTFIYNFFSNDFETKEIDSDKSINEVIKLLSKKTGSPIEVYDQDTGKIDYVYPENENFAFKVTLNNKEIDDFNIRVKDNDELVIIALPKGSGSVSNFFNSGISVVQSTWKHITSFAMSSNWAFLGTLAMPWLVAGIAFGLALYDEFKPDQPSALATKNSTGKDVGSIPDVAGSANESILDKKYPLVLGKHIITPYIIGSSYHEIPIGGSFGNKGKDSYIHILLCAGYSPLKITDIRLGDLLLAYNRNNTVNGTVNNRDTVMHGILNGFNDDTNDGGDILRRWRNNDVSIEILQKGGDSTSDDSAYSSLYPQAVIQSSPSANILFVCDGEIDSIATYKGTSFPSGYRTNSVRFSDTCPAAIEVELSAPQGLYKTRTKTVTDDNTSETEYEYNKLPIYVAIQWRMYKTKNASSSANDGSGWTSFSSINGIAPITFSSGLIDRIKNEHSGNKLPNNWDSIYESGWYGQKVFNLESFSGLKDDGSLSQMRFVARYDFSIQEAMAISGLYGTNDSRNADLNSVEVRIIRVDPCYLDETSSSGSTGKGTNYGTWSFNDILKWNYLRTWKYDEEQLKKAITYQDGKVISHPQNLSDYKKRPYSAEDSKKFTFIALKIKADLGGDVNGQLNKVNCIAESFSPTFSNETRTWSIENVQPTYKYYDSKLNEISEQVYNEKIEAGENPLKKKTGNNYNNKLRDLLWISSNYNYGRQRYFLPENYQKLYISNNIASVYLNAMIGTHLGKDAKSYEDINMMSVSEAYNFWEDVTDGSKYSPSDPEYSSTGDNLRHMKWAFNGYITQGLKLSELITNILNTGRASQIIDEKCRYKILVDKKRNYPVMLINQQNCISCSNIRSFKENISGYKVTFQNENDNYESNTIYAMQDGEDYKKPTGDVTAQVFKYVTNPIQAWSLARYNLARTLVEKEYLERTVGLAGISLQLGDLVNVQDDTILVGIGTGSRIQQLIEDEDYIYGFVTDETYEYTGELDENGKCKLGVKVLQPSKFNASRIITIRMATTQGVVMDDGSSLIPEIGTTNIVVFERRIIKDSEKLSDTDDSDISLYLPEKDNIVAFGEVGKIVSQYVVWKITPSENFKYKLLLYPYDESIYSYGASMPVIHSNMTKPNRTGDDNIELNTGITQQQLEIAVKNAVGSAYNASKGTVASTPVIELRAVAQENGIRLTWNRSIFTNRSHNYYILVSKDSGNSWNGYSQTDEEGTVISVSGFNSTTESYFYTFDRKVDRYPESDDLKNWVFKVIAKDDGYLYSPETICSVTTDTYGTWILQPPVINTRVSDRTISLILSQPPRADNKSVYGNIRHRVEIKRPDIDDEYFKPASNLNPYGSENNYKDGTGYVECDSVYIQTMPLQGQETSQIADTAYMFRVTAFNEASVSESSEKTETALCTNIQDIVKANETAKEAYIEKLSAISANLGVVKQGSLSGDDNNYWALSTIRTDDGNILYHQGAMRVGGENEYLKVTPIVNDKGEIINYEVEFKVGNFEVTSVQTKFTDELVIEERDIDTYNRVYISPEKVSLQHRNDATDDNGWFDITKIDSTGLTAKTVISDGKLLITNTSITERRSNGIDIGVQIPSANSRVYHFDTDELDQFGQTSLTIKNAQGGDRGLVGKEDSLSGIIDYNPAILAVAPYSEIGRSLYGQYSLESVLHGARGTLDFWMQIQAVESQSLWEVSYSDFSAKLVIANTEPFYNQVSDEDVFYNEESKNPVGKNYYKLSKYDEPYFADDYNEKEVGESPYNSLAKKPFSPNYVYFKYNSDTDSYSLINVAFNTYDNLLDEGLYEYSFAYNNVKEATSYIEWKYSIYSGRIYLTDMGITLTAKKWYHFGLLKTGEGLKVYIGLHDILIPNSAFLNGDMQVVLNPSQKSVLIDELLIDETVVESLEDFSLHTQEKKPWGHLDDESDWFILQAKDPSKVKTNLGKSESLQSALFDVIYPVGSIYWSMNSTNPANLFGGVWEQIEDRFIYAAGSKQAGTFGGEEKVTLTANEMPKHDHDMTHKHDKGTMRITGYIGEMPMRRWITDVSGAFVGSTFPNGSDEGDSGGTSRGTLNFDTNNEGAWTGLTSNPVGVSRTGEAGNGKEHNNMPPYLVAYCWQRTA